MIMDATVNLKTSGTGIQGNWDFNNPYEDGFKFAGIGAGVNAGVLMHGEKALISIALQRLGPMVWNDLDRKSTRLNSSHVRISYAVFCLKKKKKKSKKKSIIKKTIK